MTGADRLDIGARPATPADKATIDELRRIAHTETRPQRGGQLLLEFDRQSAVDGPPGSIADTEIVGTLNGVIVGYALLGRREAHQIAAAVIEELFVHPEARSVGIAAAMLSACEQMAVERGCTHIESEVLPGNRAAKNFFERMGMVTRKMRVSRPLD